MTDPEPTSDDDAVDDLLRRRLGSAASHFEAPAQPSITSLLPIPRRWHRWRAPAAIAGGLIAAATATVLVISSTAPSHGPGVAVAPSGPSTTTSTSSTSEYEMGRAPAPRITVNGTEYTLVGAVPWYSAMRIGNTVAVSTGPEIRGACDPQIYRLGAGRSSRGELVLTSYQYNPPKDQAQPSCGAIGLPPYVAALRLPEAPPAQALDGARSSEAALPLTGVLVPTQLPAGFETGGTNSDFPEQSDPDRPVFNAYRSFLEGVDGSNLGTIGQNFTSGTQSLTVTQGLPTFSTGYDTIERTTVGPYQATVNSFQDSPERCVRWTDDAAGKVEVCGTLNGGADAVVAVARSIYPTSPGSDGAGDGQVLVNGVAYRRVGAVPWLRAAAHRNQVSVAISALNGINCQEAHDLFRLDATRSDGALVLTVTHYVPVEQPASDCSLVGRPPFVTAVDLGSPVTETSAIDGSQQTGSTGRTPKPLVRVLLPAFVPDGFALGAGTGNRLLLLDPDRPVPIGVAGAYDAPANSVSTRYGNSNTGLGITQGIALFDSGKFEQRTTIRGQTAVVVLDTGSRCVRWQEPVIGPLQVCSGPSRSGGKPLPVDVMIKIARSMTE